MLLMTPTETGLLQQQLLSGTGKSYQYREELEEQISKLSLLHPCRQITPDAEAQEQSQLPLTIHAEFFFF